MPATTLTISLAQMNVTIGDTARNITNMQKMVAEAARRRSHIVLLPELWSTGYDWAQYRELATTMNSGIFTDLSNMAQKLNISIGGSIFEKRGLEVANSAPFFIPNGQMAGIYRKIHLFRLFNEDKYLQQGSSPLTMDLPWGLTSVAICYDLRFPELFRRYADEGATLIFIMAEWPLARIDHWRLLLQARAIENQVYIAAVNSAGQTGDQVFGGHSMIVDPWGKIIVEAGEDPMLVTAPIDLTATPEIRQRIPVLEDRRGDLF